MHAFLLDGLPVFANFRFAVKEGSELRLGRSVGRLIALLAIVR